MTYEEFLEKKRERMKRSVYIYCLLDPFTEEIRYVGKSIRPKERLTNHCNEKSVTWRTNWIQSMLAKGKRPLLRILEILDRDDDWKQAERDWIANLKARGARLTNCTSGGDGVPDLPPEIRARISASSAGRKHTPEALAKMSASRIGRRHTEENKAHMRKVMTGRKITWSAKVARAVCKLTAEQVDQIRALLAQKVPQKKIAQQFGVHQGTICNINRGRGYGWVMPLAESIPASVRTLRSGVAVEE